MTHSADRGLPAIEAVALMRNLAGVPAVQDVSITANFGQILGLLGPNGAGKTTTLKMLAGLMAPTRGELSVCGHRLPEGLSSLKREVGILTGGMKLYEAFTPVESFKYFGKLRGMEGAVLKSRIEELIGEFDLQEFCYKKFGKLSAGEQQRSTIANTLVHSPKVLILDEITLSLDVLSSSFILDFVKRERDRGRCIIFSTHVMSEAEYLCDRIALIYGGRIIDSGQATELIKRQGASNLTEAFLRAVQTARSEAA